VAEYDCDRVLSLLGECVRVRTAGLVREAVVDGCKSISATMRSGPSFADAQDVDGV
jgi:hypothetical protein